MNDGVSILKRPRAQVHLDHVSPEDAVMPLASLRILKYPLAGERGAWTNFQNKNKSRKEFWKLCNWAAYGGYYHARCIVDKRGRHYPRAWKIRQRRNLTMGERWICEGLPPIASCSQFRRYTWCILTIPTCGGTIQLNHFVEYCFLSNSFVEVLQNCNTRVHLKTQKQWTCENPKRGELSSQIPAENTWRVFLSRRCIRSSWLNKGHFGIFLNCGEGKGRKWWKVLSSSELFRIVILSFLRTVREVSSASLSHFVLFVSVGNDKCEKLKCTFRAYMNAHNRWACENIKQATYFRHECQRKSYHRVH